METETTNEVYDINMETYLLLRDEPFFGAISRCINKTSSGAIPTAGVKINKETQQFEMIYNPKFFLGLTQVERADVLKHEFWHVVNEHVTGRLPAEGMTKMWNIATDLAINGLPGVIDKIPSIGCIPGKGPFAHLPPEMSADFYFEELKKQKEQDKEKNKDKGEKGEGEGEPSDGSGDGLGEPMDDHSGWGEVDEDTKQIAKERLGEILKDAVKEASKSNNWGSVSSSMKKQIMERLKTWVDWRKMLSYFIKATVKADKTATIRKINKRFPRIHAGKKVQRLANIAISIDQSGSVGDDMLALFFNELNKLADIATFTVVPFDTMVDDSKVYVWKKGTRKVWERVLCGGTDFNAPTKWVNERNFDGHIVLTDMCAPKPIHSKSRRMWMTTKAYFDSPYFQTNEIVVAIDAK